MVLVYEFKLILETKESFGDKIIHSIHNFQDLYLVFWDFLGTSLKTTKGKKNNHQILPVIQYFRFNLLRVYVFKHDMLKLLYLG